MPESCQLSNTCADEIRRLIVAAGEAGESDKYTGKRSTMRCRAGILLEVTTDPSDPKATFSATMRDVSESGFGFLTRREIPCGAIVWVREFTELGEAPWLKTKVVHQSLNFARYNVGVLIC